MIKSFNAWFFKAICLVGLLSLLFTLPGEQKLLVLIILLVFWPSTRRFVGNLFRSLFRGVGSIIAGIWNLLWGTTKFALKGTAKGSWGLGKFLFVGFQRPSGRFMPFWKRWFWFDGSGRGLLVDGHNKRLPVDVTYQGAIIQGGMGTGKSSVFVIPNLLRPPKDQPSFVVSDTSGEIYQQTSGYLRSQGYQIRAFNLLDVTASETYNPLMACSTAQDVAELAQLLVQSSVGNQNPSDPFWNQAAEKILRIMAQCLLNQSNPQFKTLANLRHLMLSFDAHQAPKGQLGKIDQFVLQATQNDLQTFSAYKAFVGGNYKTIQSVLMSADVALDGLASPEIAHLTSSSTLDFQELRQKPTALYLMVNQTQITLYNFLLNLMYNQLFASLLKQQHNTDRAVWLMLDEFGHFKVNGFEVIATTARKYKVAIHLALQSKLQLEQQYGRYGAQIIRDGLGSQIYLPGLSLDDAREISGRLGQQNRQALMTADQIIRMKTDEALLLSGHQDPTILKTRGFYDSHSLRRRSQIPPAPLPQTQTGNVNFIPL